MFVFEYALLYEWIVHRDSLWVYYLHIFSVHDAPNIEPRMEYIVKPNTLYVACPCAFKSKLFCLSHPRKMFIEQ